MSVYVSVMALLVIAALVAAVASIMGKVPLYIAVLLLCVVELVQVLPLK